MMTTLFNRIALFLTIVALCACQEEKQEVLSPNGDLRVTIECIPENAYGEAVFSVDYKGKQVLAQTRLGMETEVQKLAGNLKLKSVSEAKPIVDDYQMLTGKRSHCMNEASERVYTFENESGQALDVTFRAYNDGVVFKYGICTESGKERIICEHTAYALPQGAKRWMQKYDIGYEGFFPLSTDGILTGHPEVDTWGYPALAELQDSVFVLLTEANIRRGHCGSLLYNGENRDCYQVRLADNKMLCEGAWESPWRVLIIGSLGDVVESTLVTDVADPSKVADTEWIKPGLVSWIYWAHNHGSKDYRLLKEYIDLAVRMKWPYNLIDWEWDEMGNGGKLEDAVKYATACGVKSLVWYNSSTAWLGPGPLYRLNKKEDRRKEYQWLSDLGVSGMKIDFFNGDSVSTMNYFIDLLEDAADYQLMVNFHGATVPRGWQRTYPHLMSVEGVYGAEWYNNNAILTDRAAAHNATLPFTRNVIGPMDYTPGTFSDSQYPHITSYGHELALPVLFESALQHMPDRPSVYAQLPEAVKQLLSVLPTAWDDTKLLAGYPGVEVVMARRKGDVWYIAGINGTDKPRTLRASLEKLSVDGKSMALFKDGADNRSFSIEENVPAGDSLIVDCLPRGGFVGVIK